MDGYVPSCHYFSQAPFTTRKKKGAPFNKFLLSTLKKVKDVSSKLINVVNNNNLKMKVFAAVVVVLGLVAQVAHAQDAKETGGTHILNFN